MKTILVINAGSSSLKYQLIDIESEAVLAKGLCERIGIDGKLTYKPTDGEKFSKEAPMPTHQEAIELVLGVLTDEKIGVIKNMEDVAAVGHHGAVLSVKGIGHESLPQRIVDVDGVLHDLAELAIAFLIPRNDRHRRVTQVALVGQAVVKHHIGAPGGYKGVRHHVFLHREHINKLLLTCLHVESGNERASHLFGCEAAIAHAEAEHIEQRVITDE